MNLSGLILGVVCLIYVGESLSVLKRPTQELMLVKEHLLIHDPVLKEALIGETTWNNQEYNFTELG